MRLSLVIFCLFISLLSSACKKTDSPAVAGPTETASPSPSPSASPTPPRPSGPIEFTDVSAQAGIHFKHNSGAFGKNICRKHSAQVALFLIMTTTAGRTFCWSIRPTGPNTRRAKSFLALYHNNQDGTFTDVTRQAGLAVEMYGIGVAAADYDNDGNEDIYIPALDQIISFAIWETESLLTSLPSRRGRSMILDQRGLVRL